MSVKEMKIAKEKNRNSIRRNAMKNKEKKKKKKNKGRKQQI